MSRNPEDPMWQGGQIAAPSNPVASPALRDVEGLTAALNEIRRLRLATDEGSLRVRADRMWEVAGNALSALSSSPSQEQENRPMWIARHLDAGHTVTKRDAYDECSCGATYWRAALSASPGRDEPGIEQTEPTDFASVVEWSRHHAEHTWRCRANVVECVDCIAAERGADEPGIEALIQQWRQKAHDTREQATTEARMRKPLIRTEALWSIAAERDLCADELAAALTSRRQEPR